MFRGSVVDDILCEIEVGGLGQCVGGEVCHCYNYSGCGLLYPGAAIFWLSLENNESTETAGLPRLTFQALDSPQVVHLCVAADLVSADVAGTNYVKQDIDSTRQSEPEPEATRSTLLISTNLESGVSRFDSCLV